MDDIDNRPGAAFEPNHFVLLAAVSTPKEKRSHQQVGSSSKCMKTITSFFKSTFWLSKEHDVDIQSPDVPNGRFAEEETSKTSRERTKADASNRETLSEDGKYETSDREKGLKQRICKKVRVQGFSNM